MRNTSSPFLQLTEQKVSIMDLVGQGQFVLEDNTFQGGGGAIQVGAVWKPEGLFHGYGFLGPVFGSYDWFDEWGLGGVSNIGGGLTLAERFTITAEAALLVYYDSFKEVTRTAVSPSLQLSYSFPTR